MLTDRQRRELYSKWRLEEKEKNDDLLIAVAILAWAIWMVL